MTKNNIKGFTVLEIMIVVLLIGIIGIATVPSIGLIRKQEVRKIAKELCLDLSAQRMQAMTANRLDLGLELLGDGVSGEYYSYRLTPALDTASGGTREKNKDNSTNIRISMKATGESGVIENPEKVQFDNYGDMVDTTGKTINKLSITITYDTAESIITFNGVTGNYKID